MKIIKKNKDFIVGVLILSFIIFSISIFSIEIFSNIRIEDNLSNIFYNLGRFMGLIGFLSLSILILSGETARFFDRFFGIDKIIKFQRKFSIFSLIMVIFHPIFFIISDRNMINFLIPGSINLIITLGSVSLYLMILIGLASHFYKLISYKVWQIIHIGIYGLFVMSAYHAMNGTAYLTNQTIRILINTIIIALIIGSIFRTIKKIKEYFNSNYYVYKTEKETKNIFSLILKPKNKNKLMKFKAGQFCFLRINKNKLHARHPFTISSSPEDNFLKFTIKIEGRFTKTAEKIKVGEPICVDGPYGKFHTKQNDENLIFIAGGVGITPFRSMLGELVNLGTNKNVRLIYCCRTTEDILFKNFFDSIDKKWFDVKYILSREKSNNWNENENKILGRLNKEIIKKELLDLKNPIFYFCGPETLKKETMKILDELGVKKRNIYSEDFFW